MHLVEFDKAIQFEAGRCSLCNGKGEVVIMGREQTFRTGRPDVLKKRCPQCGGSGKCGLRTK